MREGEDVTVRTRKSSPVSKQSKPLWKGPEKDGITFSLLSRFLCCRERFRLYVVDGLRPVDTFNHRMEYGQMWHTCEEALAGGSAWELMLKRYTKKLCNQYPLQQEQVSHWYNVCKVQFPIYVSYWKHQQDVRCRSPLLQEKVFSVPYKLPSGRVVRLRGKWDSVDIIGKGRNAAIYLQENKTKGDIKEGQIKRQLHFDLQTMIYLIALKEYAGTDATIGKSPIAGVRYNVVRRPLSGCKGSIRQHKPTKNNPNGETSSEFYSRLSGIIVNDPETYFMRWKVEITDQDVARFKQASLDPILEQICDWWHQVRFGSESRIPSYVHFRMPYGVWNSLLEGGSTDLDEYLATGSELGLERTDNLFRELS